MDLFILRHGKAGQSSDVGDDAARALTEDGKDEIKKVAGWLRSKKNKFAVIATSPLRRAFETAEIIVQSMDQQDRLTIWDELAPGADLETICQHVARYDEQASVLIVGHEPALSMLISRIISGTDNSSIVLAKGGLAKIRNYSCKHRPSGDLQWLLTPKHMTGMR